MYVSYPLFLQGICDELTYAEIKEKFPEEYKARSENKFYYRYPRGEVMAYIADFIS